MTPSQRRILMGSGANTARYIALSQTVSPYATFYKQFGQTLIKLPDPSTAPPGVGNSIIADPTGEYICVTSSTTPFFVVYQRTGDTFVALTAPATVPTQSVLGGSFSPTGGILLLQLPHDTTNNTFVYSVAGSTVTYVGVLATGLSAQATSCWSPDGTIVVFGRIGSSEDGSSLEVWTYDGSTFTERGSGIGQANVDTWDVAFSPNQAYIALASGHTPYVRIASMSGFAMTLLPNPTTIPNSKANAVAWTSDSRYLAVGYGTTPFLIVYKNIGGVFTPLTAIDVAPGSVVNGLQYTKDDQFLVVSTTLTPFVSMYRKNGDNHSLVTTPPSALPTGGATNICAFSNGGN